MHKVVTVREAPALRTVIQGFHAQSWPAFLGHDAGVSRRWDALYDGFDEHQFVLSDAVGVPLAAGNAVPVAWDGTAEGLPTAAAAGLGSVIAPVRPPGKARYPLTPMERYVTWTRPDGAPFDDWLRVHWRLGAAMLTIAPEAMVVEGGVAEWETWTGLAFPDSGAYVVDGALQPVVIDRERDRGRYCDPNVWMRHPVG
jgi:hypothetical protein